VLRGDCGRAAADVSRRRARRECAYHTDAAEACWFAILRPRLSAGFGAVLTLALLPLAVVGYLYLMTAVSAYLSERQWDLRLRQLIVLMLGLSVGCFVFALLWLAKVHFEPVLG
jgi:hypothetical protein